MKKITLCLALCLAYATPTFANASVNANTLKKQGSSLSDIVPNNWQVIGSKKGDVNNDGIDDLVFVIQDTDKNKITLNTINEFDYEVADSLFDSRHYPKSIGKNLSEVIPANWKILAKTTGDLNHDDVMM